MCVTTDVRVCRRVQAKSKGTKSADGFFKEAGAKEELSDARKADQKAVDTAVWAAQPPHSPSASSPTPSSCSNRLRIDLRPHG